MGGALAVAPGLLLHGVGHLYIGEYQTAWQLLAAELLGAALVVGGLLMEQPAQGSGPSGGIRRAMIHTGSVLFVASWLADVLGSFKGASQFDPDIRATQGSRLGIAYRYTDDIVTPFRHHLVLNFTLDTGWFYLRPLIDLESGNSLRQFQIDLGTRFYRGVDPRNHLLFGVRMRRLENEAFSYAAMGLMGYLEGRFDVGRWLPNLRNLYIFSRAGYGYEGLSFAEHEAQTPRLFADIELHDTYLMIHSGLGLNLGRQTHFEMSLAQDPSRDLRPFAALGGGFLEFSLAHQQSESLEIELTTTLGDAFGIWLGLGFGL